MLEKKREESGDEASFSIQNCLWIMDTHETTPIKCLGHMHTLINRYIGTLPLDYIYRVEWFGLHARADDSI